MANPYAGMAANFAQGMQTALTFAQMKQRQEALEARAQEQEMLKQFKTARMAIDLLDPNLPLSIREQGMKAFVNSMNALNPGMDLEMPDIGADSKAYKETFKMLMHSAKKLDKMDPALLRDAIPQLNQLWVSAVAEGQDKWGKEKSEQLAEAMKTVQTSLETKSAAHEKETSEQLKNLQESLHEEEANRQQLEKERRQQREYDRRLEAQGAKEVAVARAKAKIPGKQPTYFENPGQQVDDIRQYFSLKMRSLVDPLTGAVKEGKEAEYESLVNDLNKALSDIYTKAGLQPPDYLSEDPLGIK